LENALKMIRLKVNGRVYNKYNNKTF